MIENNDNTNVLREALTAYRFGYTPIPIVAGEKRPAVAKWQTISYADEAELTERFTQWIDEGKTNLGLVLGEASGNLVDVDVDHPKAMRMKDFFLPPTEMVSGRAERPSSHFWYVCEDGTAPGITKQHKNKDGAVTVELRSARSQTLIPPSVHPSGDRYEWAREEWGGEIGPTRIDGKVLSAQVALLGLGSVILEAWPQRGSRHEAYLALAGGLLRDGDYSVHPFWERNASVLIRALAEVTQDDDGPDQREKESITSTINTIRAGKKVVGFGRLAEIVGEDHVRQIRILVDEVEAAAGYESRQAPTTSSEGDRIRVEPKGLTYGGAEDGEEGESTAEVSDDPLDNRDTSWDIVPAEPYLMGIVKPVEPSMLLREDGAALMYPGRINMLYGSSESAKTWIALKLCVQALDAGQRVMYFDFEDEPVNTFQRLTKLGGRVDDLIKSFSYIHPEDPLAHMQRDRYGNITPTDIGRRTQEVLERNIRDTDPALIVADGMSVIYGLHGLDTNDTVQTDVITSWLKSLTNNGRTTVVVIDHSAKHAEKGSMPIGSQHKVSMVQGTLLQAWPKKQPMPGEIGEVELVVLKDRPGEVRAVSEKPGGSSKAQVAAVVTIDSQTDPDKVDISIEAPKPAATVSGSTVTVTPPPETEKQRQDREREERRQAHAQDLANRIIAHFQEQAAAGNMQLTRKQVVDAFSDEPEPTVQRVLYTLAGLPDGIQKPLPAQCDIWLRRTGPNKRSYVFELILTEEPEAPIEVNSEKPRRRFTVLPNLDDLDTDPGDPRDQGEDE